FVAARGGRAGGGGVALQERAGVQPRHDRAHLGSSDDETAVRPRRYPGQRIGKLEGLKDEQARDALSPGSTGLERRRDDDVVRARNDIVPAGRVEVMALVDAGALWDGRGH